jgi:hypothetical protein
MRARGMADASWRTSWARHTVYLLDAEVRSLPLLLAALLLRDQRSCLIATDMKSAQTPSALLPEQLRAIEIKVATVW